MKISTSILIKIKENTLLDDNEVEQFNKLLFKDIYYIFRFISKYNSYNHFNQLSDVFNILNSEEIYRVISIMLEFIDLTDRRFVNSIIDKCENIETGYLNRIFKQLSQSWYKRDILDIILNNRKIVNKLDRSNIETLFKNFDRYDIIDILKNIIDNNISSDKDRYYYMKLLKNIDSSDINKEF